VVVVGGGPAGLEAARVSAIRGHDIELLESRLALGGALALWAKLPGREAYQESIIWWERELKRLGVKIHLGTPASAAGILAKAPDAVILATGSLYSAGGRSNHRDLDISGFEQNFVVRPEEILLGQAKPSGKILVLDGEGMHAAVGIAEMLGSAGNDVEFLTPYLAPISPRLTGTQDAPFIMKRLRQAGVKISAMSYIKHIGDHKVTVCDVYSEDERIIENVDAVVLATGRIQVNHLEQELDGKVAQLFTVGDALAVRMWSTASFEGHKFARYIGEPNAPANVADVYFGPDDPLLMAMPADMARPKIMAAV
jgi:pyruvate/2-oxoglutarate dehydrogenase complex dihydrolipoamide dehydrogenase (E3) component